jgi:hypothetical protein
MRYTEITAMLGEATLEPTRERNYQMKPLSVNLSNCVGQLTQIFQDEIFAQYFDKPFTANYFPIKVTSKGGTFREFNLFLQPVRNEAQECNTLRFKLALREDDFIGPILLEGSLAVAPYLSLAKAILCAVHISGDCIKFAFNGIVAE